jgi:hypothetical protein
MKSVLSLLLYLQTWAPNLLWMRKWGLVLLVATIPLFLLFGGKPAFVVSVIAYFFLAFPYLLVWSPLRLLLANRRFALLPGFHVRVGLALLILTLLMAIYLPLSSRLFMLGAIGWPIAIRIFFICSCTILLMQWACASRWFGHVSIGLFVLSITAFNFRGELSALARTPGFDLALLSLSLLLWCLALRVLATRHLYAAPGKVAAAFALVGITANPVVFYGYSPGILRKIRSPATTLLLGYPDNLLNRICFCSPYILAVLTLVLMRRFLPSKSDELSADFTFTISLAISSMSPAITLLHGQLVNNSRLLWLRRGGDRKDLWRFLERTLLSNFAIISLWWIAAALAVLAAPLPLKPHISTLLPMVLAICLTTAYYGVAARAGQWNGLWLIGLSSMLAALMYIATFKLPSLALLITLALSLLFRNLAKGYFLEIDWRSIKPLGAALRT